MSIVTAVWNRAGGQAKTTLVKELGYEILQQRPNTKLLLIDADSQANLGESFGLSPHTLPESDLFWSQVCSNIEVPDFKTVSVQGLQIGLSNLKLTNQERELERSKNLYRLRVVLDQVKDRYDLILIDCPPSESELVVQVLLACDSLVIPVLPEDKGISGYLQTQEVIMESNKRRKPFLPPIKVVGVVPTKVENVNIHRHQVEQIQVISEGLEYPIFPNFRKYIAVTEAYNRGLPLRLYDPKCKALEDLESIASAFLKTLF